jgi:2-oxoglutarate dehydrogenase E1 component
MSRDRPFTTNQTCAHILCNVFPYTRNGIAVTGGCIHLVINNQIGFTTDPRASRSTPYCTEVAKSIRAPIFHVNGDDVEALVRVCRLAVEFRLRFHKDVVVDLVCYRRNGHQEIDNPMFTQPRMYSAIKSHEPVLDLYAGKLLREGIVGCDALPLLLSTIQTSLEGKLAASRVYVPQEADWMVTSATSASIATAAANAAASGSGAGVDNQDTQLQNGGGGGGGGDGGGLTGVGETGVGEEQLRRVGEAVTVLPATLSPHRVVSQLYRQRARMLQTGDIDWALAEQLAWGTLLVEGHHVRVSGQDVERGTFSHRHAVVHDQVVFGRKYTALEVLGSTGPAVGFTICNSSLSEFAVLGFELGYSIQQSSALVIWEAQFGDFANTAQCIFDQFISAGESKWQLRTGLVVLLPHGLEGGGPEHSSARLERYLQLCCNDDEHRLPSAVEMRVQEQACNMQVVNVTTPANFFHVLRRQLKRPFRKPLIVMTPKSLLRHKGVRSPLSAFLSGSKFEPVLPAKTSASKRVRKLIFCSGRVAFDLLEACGRVAVGRGREGEAAGGGESENVDDIAIYKLEQISPFPYEQVKAVLQANPATRVVWCQEEPRNAGAWSYVSPRFKLFHPLFPVLAHLEYCGRAPSAAPATGLSKLHDSEKEAFLGEALG